MKRIMIINKVCHDNCNDSKNLVIVVGLWCTEILQSAHCKKSTIIAILEIVVVVVDLLPAFWAAHGYETGIKLVLNQNSKIQLHHFFVHTLFCPATTTLPTFIFKYKPYTYIMQILSSKLGHCIFQQGPRKKWQIRRFRFHFFTTEQDRCVRWSAQHFLVWHEIYGTK